MDRTMYGKVLPGTYYPFRCAMKENGISPGYALLADLQNSINPGGRVGSPGRRTSSPGARTSSPGGRTSSPIGRGGSPGRLSSPGGSLSSPTSTGYGSINGSKNITADYQKPASPTYQNSSVLHEKVVPVKYAGSQSYGSPGTGYGRTGSTGGRGNLSELDTLLDDLSNARYGSYGNKSPVFNDRIDGYGRTNGATSPASTRPTVDSLLDQLSTDLHNGAPPPHSPAVGSTTNSLPRPGTKQVTVTVKETVVEPAAAPIPTPAQQQTIVTTKRHASSATRELDDLMASMLLLDA